MSPENVALVRALYPNPDADLCAEVEIICASIATIRDRKLARWEDYPDRTAALEAVGLREQP